MPTKTLPDDDTRYQPSDLTRRERDTFDELTSTAHYSRNAVDPTELKRKEQGQKGPESVSGGDTQKPSSSAGDSTGTAPDLVGELYRGRGKRRFWTRKKVVGGSLATVGIVGLGAALITSFSSLLLPTLSFNIDNNRLARVTRNFMTSTDMIIKYKLALDSTGDAQYADALRYYGGDFTGNSLWAKLNRLRPDKIAERLVLDMQFEYTDRPVLGTSLTRRVVSGFTLGGNPPQTITIPSHSTPLRSKIFHPAQYISSLIQYRRDTKGLVKNFLQEVTPDDTSWIVRKFQGLVIRGKAAKELRQQLRIKTWRWSREEVKKANTEGVENPVEEEQIRSYQAASGEGSIRAQLATGGDPAALEAIQQTDACFKDVACIQEVNNSGDTIAPQVRAGLDASFDPKKITNMVAANIAAISSVADVGNLACKMYDASIMSSKDIINANNAMAMASYASFSAAPAQMIYTNLHPDDPRINTTQYGALNYLVNGKVGETEAGGAGQSNPMKAANNMHYDTAESLSPQASAIGSFATNPFGFLNFAGQGAGIAVLVMLGDPDAMNAWPGMGNALAALDVNFCDTVTNLWVQAGLLVIEAGVTFIPGVGQALKGAGTAISKFAAWTVTKQLTKTVGKQFTLRNLAEAGAYYAADNVISMIAIAHAIQKMGGIFNGTAVGAEYLNQIDSGAEVQAQEVMRASGARPLTEAQYLSAEQTDNDFRVAALQDQSFSQRYFALSNPQSLANRLAVNTYLGALSFNASGVVSGALQAAAGLFNPSRLVGALTSFGNHSFALESEEPSSEVLSRDYGITQFGWTNDEMEAFRSDPEYSPLVNEDELDASGRRDEIDQKYRRCFSLDEPMGNLLAGNPEPGQAFDIIRGDFSGAIEKLPAIVRDSNANVNPDLGLCAPNNLGDSGPDNDGRLTFKSEEAQLVFRYRISLLVHDTVDQLLSIQDPSPDVAVGGDATGLVTADGYSFPLDPTQTYTQTPCNQYTCHHDGTPAYDLFYGPEGTMSGKPVFAISDGTIISAHPYPSSNPVPGCYSIQFLSDDTYYYWYGHIQNPKVKPGDRVKAGQQIAEVADLSLGSRCRGRRDHLHIDRGCVNSAGEPQTAGRVSCRDPSFVPFLKDLWLKQHYARGFQQ